MPSEYRHCKIRLQMEQQRFLNFGLEAGVLYTDGVLCETLRINRSLLLAVLAEIKTLFEDYAKINGKYVDHTAPVAIGKDDQAEPETDLVSMLFLPLDDSPSVSNQGKKQEKNQRLSQLRKIVKGVVQTGRKIRAIALEPKHLVWATVDQSSFQSLIAKLGNFNSFLIALLDSARTESLQLTMDTSYNEILQIRDDLNSLTGLVKALSNDTDERGGSLDALALNVNLFGDSILQETEVQRKKKRYLKKLTEVKIQYKHIHDQTDTESVISDRKPLDLSLFNFDSQDSVKGFPEFHTFATYEGRRVWIEWSSYSSNQLNTDSVNYMPEDRIRLLVELLSNEMPTAFRSPHCLGYITSDKQDDQIWFGIVFEKPSEDPSTQIVTLQKLLQSRPVPSLSARISLCAAVAECIHTFHTVNWLHKGLRSDKIVFFSQRTSEPDLEAPYVLGYKLSRPNILDELTEKPRFNACEDIYRHPFAQSSQSTGNYHKSYDIYSLGILLIEIASWMPIHKFLGFSDLASVRPSALLTVQRQLLEDGNSLQRISSILGNAYMEIVELCLRADEVERPAYGGESKTSITVRLQRTLEQNIVRKLGNMARVMR